MTPKLLNPFQTLKFKGCPHSLQFSGFTLIKIVPTVMHGMEHRWPLLRYLLRIAKVPTPFWYPFSDHRNKGWTNGRLVFCSQDLFPPEYNNLILYFLQQGLGPPSFLLTEVFFWEMSFAQNALKCFQYFLKITHNVEVSEHIKLNRDDSNYGKSQTIDCKRSEVARSWSKRGKSRTEDF